MRCTSEIACQITEERPDQEIAVCIANLFYGWRDCRDKLDKVRKFVETD